MDEISEGFFELYFKRSPVKYSIIALILGIFVILVYWIFTFFTVNLPWDIFTIVPAFAMGSCLTVQLIGIPYFIVQIKITFYKSLYNGERPDENTLFNSFNSLMNNKKLLLLILLLVIIPFFILNLVNFFSYGLIFYGLERTHTALLLDIFNFGMGYLLLYLLGVLLWILLIISLVYYSMSKDPYQQCIKIDLLSPDGVVGLQSLHSLLRTFLSFYFIVLTLLILSYISPSTIISGEVISVILLMIIGLSLFYIGFNTLNNLVKRRTEKIVEKLNKKIREQSQKVIDDNLDEMNPEQVKDLEKIKLLLEIYYGERDRILSIINKNRVLTKQAILQPGLPFTFSLIIFLLNLSKSIS